MSNKKCIESEVCAELRRKRKNGVPYKDLSEMYTMDVEDIIKHVNGSFNCSNDENSIDSLNDEPWTEEFVVKTLYRDLEYRFTEMADIMDCHSETAKKYVDKFNISPIDSSNRTSSPRVNKLQRLGKEEGDNIEIREDR